MSEKYARAFVLVWLCWVGYSTYAQPQQQLKAFVQHNAQRMGLTSQDAAAATIFRSYADVSGTTFFYMNQTYRGITVWNGIISVALRNDSLLSTAGSFIPDIEQKAGTIQPTVSPIQALQLAERHLGLSVGIVTNTRSPENNLIDKNSFVLNRKGSKTLTVNLVWLPVANIKQLVLAWNVSIEQKSTGDWWNVRIDAQTGNYLESNNWAVNEKTGVPATISTFPAPTGKAAVVVAPVVAKQRHNTSTKADMPLLYLNAPPPLPNVTAGYRVVPFPRENPASGFGVIPNPWMAALPYNADAITSQWHSDNSNSYPLTRGNNVFAFTNPTDTDIADSLLNRPDSSTTPMPDLTFSHIPNFAVQPDGSTDNKRAAIDNLFYWTNLMHDIFYQYGFTEVAGNMQQNNFGRGGKSNDWLYAYAQDGADFNNAKFMTPPDSINPKLRLYQWQTAPVFTVTGPSSLSGTYLALESTISNKNKLKQKGTLTDTVLLYNDDVNGWINYGCRPATNNVQLNGKIALIYSPDRGCGYNTKAKNAQNAGARGVIMYSNSAVPFAVEDTIDNSDTIPVISVSKAIADSIITRLENGETVQATIQSGIYKDAAFDNGIICHEFGHGVSHRLAPSVNCLSNKETPDEGWSDYFALMMTTNWASAQLADSNGQRTVGSYVNSGPGIRRKSYSTKLSINPYTYDSLATNTEVHAIGEIWCSALWAMTWNIIGQQRTISSNLYAANTTGGNVMALNLVIKGLQLMPCNPGFLDARDAILRADSILYGSANKCAIWNAFARRGMGKSALQGDANNATDQVAAYNLPDSICPTGPLPIRLTNITATSQSGGILVAWQNAIERDVHHYEVQKAADGSSFRTVAQAAARLNNGSKAVYDWLDTSPFEGSNFYRIRAVETNGGTFYSGIVKVNSSHQPGIVIYPNPITGNRIFIQLNNRPAGIYQVSLLNGIGQLVLQQTLNHPTGAATYEIAISAALPKGIYQLKIMNGTEKIVKKVVYQ